MAYSDLFKVAIDGVDRTSYVAKPSITVNRELNGRSNATFSLIDGGDGVHPSLYQEVIITEEESPQVRLFAGVVMAFEEERRDRAVDTTTIRVRCQDYSAYLDRRIVAKSYTLTNGGTLDVVVNDIYTNHLSDTGITWNGVVGPPDLVFEILFNYESVRSAFDKLAELSKWSWKVDENKELIWFDPTVGEGAASISLTDSSENFETLTVKKQSNFYANRVWVKNSSNASSIWTDTHAGDGVTYAFSTSYALQVKPDVYIDGVQVLIGTTEEVVAAASGTYQFYYVPNGIGIFVALGATIPGDTSPATTPTIEIKYPSPVNQAVYAEDAALIAADGLIEHVTEVQDMDDGDALQQYADYLLDRLKSQPDEVSFSTRKALIQPGQTISINTTTPLVNGTYLIDSVSSRETHRRDDNGDIRATLIHECVATTDRPQKPANAVRFFRRLLERGSNTQDRGAATGGGGAGGGDTGAGMSALWAHDATETSPDSSEVGTITGSVDGSNTQFVLANLPDPKLSLKIWVNGVKYDLSTDYSLSASTVTFTFAPPSGSVITAHYQYRVAVETSPGIGGASFPPSIARRYTTDGNVGHITYDATQSWIRLQDDVKWTALDDLSIFAWIKHRATSQRLSIVAHGYQDSFSANRTYELQFPAANGADGIRYGHDTTAEVQGQYNLWSGLTLESEKAYFICVVRDSAAKTVSLYIGDKETAPALISTQAYTNPPVTEGGYSGLAQGIRIGKALVAGTGVTEISNGDIGPMGIAKRKWASDEITLAYRGNPALTDLVLWNVPGEDPDDGTFINLVSQSDTATVNLAPLISDF